MNLAREPEMGADVYHAPAVQCYIKITHVRKLFYDYRQVNGCFYSAPDVCVA